MHKEELNRIALEEILNYLKSDGNYIDFTIKYRGRRWNAKEEDTLKIKPENIRFVKGMYVNVNHTKDMLKFCTTDPEDLCLYGLPSPRRLSLDKSISIVVNGTYMVTHLIIDDTDEDKWMIYMNPLI